MKNTVSTFLFLVTCWTSYSQTKDIDVNYMLRANIYAQSSLQDSTSLGGFGSSDNAPKKITKSSDFNEAGLFLKIDTSKLITIAEKFNGYIFYIVNKSDDIVEFDASDSRLYVSAEAFIDNQWQPIEYFPSSGCGNSYHKIYLKSNEYWEFKIPKFDGKITTKIRYKLRLGKDKYVYSNEIAAKINIAQLSEKQGHQRNGLMDPYTD